MPYLIVNDVRCAVVWSPYEPPRLPGLTGEVETGHIGIIGIAGLTNHL
jgi:hypothetical protein